MAKTSKQATKAVVDNEAVPMQDTTSRPLSTRGNIFQGKVVSAKVPKTITVAWERKEYIPKYERYRSKLTKVKAHVPSTFDVAEGDIVRIAECRPIIKTKKFVVIEKIMLTK